MWTVPRANSGKANTDASKKEPYKKNKDEGMHNMGEGIKLDENKYSLLDPNGDGNGGGTSSLSWKSPCCAVILEVSTALKSGRPQGNLSIDMV